MRARRFSGGLVLMLLVAGSAGTATAASGSISIGSGGADGEVAGGFGSAGQVGPIPTGPWNPSFYCETGGSVHPGGEPNQYAVTEFRWATEFPLAGLPEVATVTGAFLALTVRTDRPDLLTQVAIYGYAGEGLITEADVTVTGTPVLITPASSGVREQWDVTSLLTAEMLTAGWAGFSLRQEPFNGLVSNVPWDCRDRLYPILTIEYAVPDPIQAPATPVQGALPNTAVADQSSSGVPLIPTLALFLAGACGYSALVSHRKRHRI